MTDGGAGTGRPEKRSTSRKKAGQRATSGARPEGGTLPPCPTPGRPAGEGLLVVGIGASAGGLEAFEAFLRWVPEASGLAFVLCPHLDPEHVSLLPELLQRHTKMVVRHIRDGERVQPDRVHVVPPNRDLAIRDGRLLLTARPRARGARYPIDGFLRSLAEDQGPNAVGIVLSGTGTDGALGLREIKAGGGLVVVQDPESARYDGMPRSAVSTGMADFVLPPDQMPGELVRYARTGSRLAPEAPEGGPVPALPGIFSLLRARTGHDFSHYKQKTLLRRIERRMHVHQIPDIDHYVRYLEDSEQEAKALFKELLIGVSSFFRDPEAFAALEADVLPGLLGERTEGSDVRVWVPGCGTGEEAYSIGILLLERMREANRRFTVQIFGTDLDAGAIDFARHGLYPESIAADMSPERLGAWFTKEGDRYRVNRQVRELLVFAPHNVARDPPFAKLDLLSCRNLLIYFDSELQRRLLPVFQYCLNAGGILFLGSSETIGPASDLFEAVDGKRRIFRKKVSALFPRRLPQLHRPAAGAESGLSPAGQADPAAQRLAEAVLEKSGAPPCVIVDSTSAIVYVHGRTGRFLEPPAGKATMNVVDMARPGLKTRLSTALRTVRRDRREIVLRGVRVTSEGGPLAIDVTVRPVDALGTPGELLMVSFQEAGASAPADGEPEGRAASGKRPTAEELELELEYARECLRTTVEQLETSNEELTSANEELQSANEEFQSTNEELETSQEELQSLNEEATTVNAELQGRIEELAAANDDMQNLLDSAEIATLFLDRELRVRRFTPRLTGIIPLTPNDVGRPVKHFAVSLRGIDLGAIAARALDTLEVQEAVAPHAEGGWYQLRLLPYRTASGVIDGVVMTFQDVTAQERAMEAAGKARAYAESIVDTIREPLLVLERGMRVITANPAFYQAFGVRREETEGSVLWSLGDGRWDLPELRRLLEELLQDETVVVDYEVASDFPPVGRRRFMLNARRMAAADQGQGLVLLAMEDVTEHGS